MGFFLYVPSDEKILLRRPLGIIESHIEGCASRGRRLSCEVVCWFRRGMRVLHEDCGCQTPVVVGLDLKRTLARQQGLILLSYDSKRNFRIVVVAQPDIMLKT